MARISGIDLPGNKRIVIALTYIFGIGKYRANEICKKMDFASSLKKMKMFYPPNNFSFDCPIDSNASSPYKYCHSLEIRNSEFEGMLIGQPTDSQLSKTPDPNGSALFPFPSRAAINLEEFEGPVIIQNCSFK